MDGFCVIGGKYQFMICSLITNHQLVMKGDKVHKIPTMQVFIYLLGLLCIQGSACMYACRLEERMSQLKAISLNKPL